MNVRSWFLSHAAFARHLALTTCFCFFFLLSDCTVSSLSSAPMHSCVFKLYCALLCNISHLFFKFASFWIHNLQLKQSLRTHEVMIHKKSTQIGGINEFLNLCNWSLLLMHSQSDSLLLEMTCFYGTDIFKLMIKLQQTIRNYLLNHGNWCFVENVRVWDAFFPPQTCFIHNPWGQRLSTLSLPCSAYWSALWWVVNTVNIQNGAL